MRIKALGKTLTLVGLLLFLVGGGQVLAASCTACGFTLAPNARFCQQCGTRVPTKVSTSQAGNTVVAGEKKADVHFRYAVPVAKKKGRIKIGSAPIRCRVDFLGRVIEKKRAIQTVTEVPVGRYKIRFSKDGRSIEKEIIVLPGKDTLVFGNLLGSRIQKNKPDSSYRLPPSAKRGRSVAPSRMIADADLLYDKAEALRRAVNPFAKADRYRQAEALYLQLVETYPRSDKVGLSLYELGNIYESAYYRNYVAAIDKYKQVLDHNFKTALDVRWRIAILYDKGLLEHARGKGWYQLAAKYSLNPRTRKRAVVEAGELDARGF